MAAMGERARTRIAVEPFEPDREIPNRAREREVRECLDAIALHADSLFGFPSASRYSGNECLQTSHGGTPQSHATGT